jgi:hypothetical protein
VREEEREEDVGVIWCDGYNLKEQGMTVHINLLLKGRDHGRSVA